MSQERSKKNWRVCMMVSDVLGWTLDTQPIFEMEHANMIASNLCSAGIMARAENDVTTYDDEVGGGNDDQDYLTFEQFSNSMEYIIVDEDNIYMPTLANFREGDKVRLYLNRYPIRAYTNSRGELMYELEIERNIIRIGEMGLRSLEEMIYKQYVEDSGR